MVLNFWPCIRGTGVKVTYLSEDFSRLKVKLPLSWRTRNLVGTIFGGSLYGSTDPFFMLMLIELLGKSYVVWDKGCTIRFKRPAKTTLFADFHITPEMLAKAKSEADGAGETTFTWKIEHKDKEGKVYADFEKVLYVATKTFYAEKLKKRS